MYCEEIYCFLSVFEAILGFAKFRFPAKILFFSKVIIYL